MAKKKVPIVVTIAGVILILAGASSLFCGIFQGNKFMTSMQQGPLQPPAQGKVKLDPRDNVGTERFVEGQMPGFITIMLVLLGFEMVCGVGQFITAIGVTTRLSGLAKLLAIGFTGAKLLAAIGGFVYQSFFMLPVLNQLGIFDPALNMFLIGGYPLPPSIQFVVLLLVAVLLSTSGAGQAFAGIPETPPEVVLADDDDGDDDEDRTSRKR